MAQNPHLVAWSMGGALVSLYSMKHAGRVNRMVLIAPGIVISAGHWIRQALHQDLATPIFIKAGQKILNSRMRQQFHIPDDYEDYFERTMIQTRRKGFWESLVSIIVNFPDNLLDILHYYPDSHSDL